MIGINEIGFWAGISGVILAWFSCADEGLDLPKKWARHLFLADRTTGNALNEGGWLYGFSKMFDRIFGKRHFSIICYKRTMFSSLVAVLSASIYVLFSSTEGTGFTNQFSPFTTLQFWVFAILVNGTVDYISLLETRFLINKMKHMSSLFLQLLTIIADLVFTIILFVISLHVFLLVLSNPYGEAMHYFDSVAQGGEKNYQAFVMHLHVFHLVQNIWSIFANGKTVLFSWFGVEGSGGFVDIILPGEGFSSEGVSSEIFFITTFITSIWLWFYTAAVAFIKVISASSPMMSVIRKTFRWRQRPMLSLGLIAVTLWSIGFWSWALFFS